MKLVNGYKVMYEKGTGEDRKIYATKNIIPATDDSAVEPNFGSYPDGKLFYVKDEKLHVSNSNIPTANDEDFTVTCEGEVVLGDQDTLVAMPVALEAETAVETPKKSSRKKAVEVVEEESGEE